MFKFIPQVLSRAQLLHQNVYGCHVPHLMTKHLSQLTIKATRRSFLNKTVLNQAKDVVFGEARKPQDRVLTLKQAGKCPGVILPYNQDKSQEIDIVLPGKAMKTRSEKKQYPLQRVHVRVEGKDHLCILASVKFNMKNFIEKVYFREYVPGKANYLKVPVNVTHLEESVFFHQGYEFNINVEEIEIISYNHEYPTKFYIDISYVNPDRPYRIGDLANTFPPGIVLNPKVDPNKVVFDFKEPEIGMTAGQNVEEILANINYGKDQEKEKEKAKATGGATPAGGKADAGKTDAKAATKAEPVKAEAKKKK